MEPKKISRYVPWIVFTGLIVASLQLRTFQIDTRPPHSDESVNFLFVETTNRMGYYPYSHENYHGPLFFYIITGLVNLLGDSLLGLRAGSIICGTLTVVALLLFVELEGWSFVLISALMIAISPSMVFFSRYAIHEPLLVLSSLLFAASLYRWTVSHRVREIYLAALAVAIMITTKETFAIIFFSVGLAILAVTVRKEDLREIPKLPSLARWLSVIGSILLGAAAAGRTYPSPQTAAAIGMHQNLVAALMVLAVTLSCVAVSAMIYSAYRSQFPFLRAQLTHVSFAFAAVLVAVMGTFSAGFRWFDGLGEMARAIPQWVGRSSSDTGHVKVFQYYLNSVLWVTEPSLVLGLCGVVLLVLLSAILSFVRGDGFRPLVGPALGKQGRALIFSGVWLLSAFLVYSAIPYKTVWLIINLSLPALLFVSAAISALIRSPLFDARLAGLGFLLWATYSQFQSMLHYNFVELPLPGTKVALAESVPYGPMNPFSYVHTSPGTLDVVQEVFDYWKVKPKARVLIGIEGYFPLPYYFRKHASQCAYMKITDIDKASQEYDIMILDYYKQNWDHAGWTKRYHRLSDYAESYTYFRTLTPEEAAPLSSPQPTAPPSQE
ncbi:MAG: TIGR03663 family protein [Bdellovibrionota bacterium]